MPTTRRQAEERVTPVGTPKEAWPHAQSLARELKAIGVYALVHEDPRGRRLFSDDTGRRVFFLTHLRADRKDAAESVLETLQAYWKRQLESGMGTLSAAHASERTGEKTGEATGVVRFGLANWDGKGFFDATLEALRRAGVPVQSIARVDDVEEHAKDLRLARLVVARKPNVRAWTERTRQWKRVDVDFKQNARTVDDARRDADAYCDLLLREFGDVLHASAENGRVVAKGRRGMDLLAAPALDRLQRVFQKAEELGGPTPTIRED